MQAQTTEQSVRYASLPWLDIQSDEYKSDAYAVITRARAQSDVVRSQRGVEFLGHSAMEQILRDRTLETPTTNYFVAKGAGPVATEMFNQGMIVHMEAARHLQHRKAFVSAFSRAKVAAQTDVMFETADALIDEFVGKGACEVIDDFTHLYSISVLCQTMGVDLADVPKIAKATIAMHWLLAYDMRPGNAELEPALAELKSYVTDVLEQRRAAPGDDFMSVLVREQPKSGLTDDEIIWNFVNMLFAGHDTTRFQLATIVHELICQGVWEDLAAYPEEKVPLGIAESMRRRPIVQYRTRVATQECEVDGVLLEPGTNIAINWLAAMRDPRHFERPDEFWLERPLDRRLDFGSGVHRCIGEALAQAEMEVAVTRLVARLKNPAIEGDVTLRPFDTGIGGPTAVHLKFTKR